MALRTYNDYVSRIAAGYSRNQPIWDEANTATTATLLANNFITMQRLGYSQVMPGSLPSGVTNFIPTSVSLSCSSATQMALVGEIINLGNLNIAGPTFTDGASMPTRTELGTSRTCASAVIVEVTTVLNATPGSITITYVDQDGNSAETTTAQALTASSTVKSAGMIVLNGTDWGVRDITSANRTGGTTPTGVVNFWGMLPICLMDVGGFSAELASTDNLLTSAVNVHRMGISAQIGVFTFSTTAKGIVGNMFLVGDS